MELYFEVFIFEKETGKIEYHRFSNVREAYEYACDLKNKGFEPYIAHYYSIKV